MQPKVTIIIPVYNVEQYLRQCLDSVVNQTMQEIQIICVNDGSTDGSLAILQEYATRDSRIEIIDKPNGGPSSARNAAYPLIKGKYLTFVDSDDWIDATLCEKTYQKAEATQTQMVNFFSQRTFPHYENKHSYKHLTSDDKTTVEEKLPLLNYTGACIKIWRTDFFLGNNLYFPEGLFFEDNFVVWKAVTLANKVSIVPEQLYYHRYTPGSTTQASGKHVLDIVPIYNLIREYLLESGYYAAYRDTFLRHRLVEWCGRYHGLSSSLKSRYRTLIRESLSADDWKFLRTAPQTLLPAEARLFYEMIGSKKIAALKYHFWRLRHQPAKFFSPWIPKPLKNLLKAASQMISESKNPAEPLQANFLSTARSGLVWLGKKVLFSIVPHHIRVRLTLKRRYRLNTGKPLNLKQPKTLGEKIQWLKLYYHNPILTQLADKYAVRPYVAEKIGEEHLIPLIGVYESVSEIDFDKLPEKFILKATHGCGWNIICKDKQHFDVEDAKQKLTQWLGTNYYDGGFEWQYKDMKPRIICETLLERPDGKVWDDYKIFLFNGVPRFFQVEVGRETNVALLFFDMDWGRIPVKRLEYPNDAPFSVPRPERLDKMLALACQLAPDVPLVRVDFYVHEGKIYFGELTFTPAGGNARWDPEQYGQIFGDMLVLPDKPFSAESH